MLVTMEIVVVASRAKFLAVAFSLACLPLFQSKFMKIMFTAAVLCGSGPVPRSVALDNNGVGKAETETRKRNLLEPILQLLQPIMLPPVPHDVRL